MSVWPFQKRMVASQTDKVDFNTDFRTRIIQFLAMTFNKQVCSVKDMAILKVCEDGYEMRHRFLVFLVQHSNVLLPWILQQHELSPNAIRRLVSRHTNDRSILTSFSSRIGL